MSAIASLCIQDGKRLLTNALFWVLSATLVVIILVVDFALPAQVVEEELQFVTYQLAAGDAGTAVSSREEVYAAVREGGAVGLIGENGGVTVVHPNLSQKTLNAVLLMLGEPAKTQIAVEVTGGMPAVPFNLRTVPIFICLEALLTGFVLGGALMLDERESGAVRALRVAPVGVLPYILAKTLLFSLIGTAYAALIAVCTVGPGINWLLFVPLTLAGSAVFTLIGLAFTSPFRDMGGWFFSMTLLLSVNMIPVLYYTSPIVAPAWMKAIPSYPLLFTYERALFGGRPDLLFTAAALIAWCLIAFLLARVCVARVFLKGAGE